MVSFCCFYFFGGRGYWKVLNVVYMYYYTELLSQKEGAIIDSSLWRILIKKFRNSKYRKNSRKIFMF